MPLHLFKWTHSLQLQHSSFCDGLALQAFEMEPFEQWVHCVAVTPILVCRPEQNLESHSQHLRASEQESEVSMNQQMEIVDLRQKRPATSRQSSGQRQESCTKATRRRSGKRLQLGK